MNSISIRSNQFLSPLVEPSRTFPSSNRYASSPRSPQAAHVPAGRRFSTVDDRVSSGLTLGLFAFTLPAVGYAFHQLWLLVGGETLNHAVRAFAP